MYDPIRGSSREASLSFVNKVEPIFVVEANDISADSQFFVFAQNPVGNSQGVSIAASHISGMKQGKSIFIISEDSGLSSVNHDKSSFPRRIALVNYVAVVILGSESYCYRYCCRSAKQWHRHWRRKRIAIDCYGLSLCCWHYPTHDLLPCGSA